MSILKILSKLEYPADIFNVPSPGIAASSDGLSLIVVLVESMVCSFSHSMSSSIFEREEIHSSVPDRQNEALSYLGT